MSEDSARATAIGLCASSGEFSIAVRAGAGAVHQLATGGMRQSAEATLLLDRLLARVGRQPRDIVEVRVDRGPGSYTGLRMALTFARVLAAFAGARLRAATSLELLALAAWHRHGVPHDRAIRPFLDARRQRAHTARVELAGGLVSLASPPQAVPLADCARLLQADETALLAPSLAPSVAVMASPLPPIHAGDLFHPALAGAEVAAADLEPLYLIGSYAE